MKRRRFSKRLANWRPCAHCGRVYRRAWVALDLVPLKAFCTTHKRALFA